jgi:acyl carrier protein
MGANTVTREAIRDDLTVVFRKVFEDPALVATDELVAADVPRWDSLTNVVMIADVENHFGIKIKLREILQMKKVGDLIDCIERHVSKQG